VLFRDGTKTIINLDEAGQSVGIFLKIFAPVPDLLNQKLGMGEGGQRTAGPCELCYKNPKAVGSFPNFGDPSLSLELSRVNCFLPKS